MASEVKTNKISPATSTTINVGDSGDTLALAVDDVTGFNVGSDARGDILYHDGTDYTRLAKPGTPADELLTFATGASDPAWVAAAAGGIILQVLQHNLQGVISTTSTSYVASGLSVAITPASTSSRILLMCSGGACGSSANNMKTLSTFYVGGAEVSDTGPYEGIEFYFGANASMPHSMSYIHSPATTSATTYTVYYKAEGNTSYFNNGVSSRVMLTVMELSS